MLSKNSLQPSISHRYILPKHNTYEEALKSIHIRAFTDLTPRGHQPSTS